MKYLLPLLLLSSFSFAQTRLLRQPDISSTQIVFSYANDLWIVAKAGGSAQRLTSFPGQETRPHFSPDEKTIAFSAQYGGNTDVYIVPVTGGEPKRLTWHPSADFVHGWSPDGKVVFSSSSGSVPNGTVRIFSIGMNEALPTPLPMPRANRGEFSPDGKSFAYEFVSPWDEEWRNYRGGQNRPIWIMNLADYSIKKLPWENSHDMQPVWIGTTIYFLSDRDLTMNVYSYDTQSSSLKQLTNFNEYDVKNLSSGGGSLIFEYGGDLYTLDPSSGKSEKLNIEVRGDFPWMMPYWKNVVDALDGGSLSPNGVRALFEARGEIITIPTDKGDYRNLTNSPGARDHDAIWSPDGKNIAWFSDASGEYSLYIANQDGLQKPREIKIPSPTYYYSPTWSPDGKHIAYTDHLQQLWMTNVETGKTTLVDKDNYLHPERTLNPVWSPDSRWLGYSKRLVTQYHVIMAYSVDQAKALQLTDGLSDAVSPAWDASGKYLYFLASTNYALLSGWLDMSSLEHPLKRSAYLIVLKKGEPSPFLPESDEEKVERMAEEAKKEEADKKAKTKTTLPPPPKNLVSIDPDGIGQRIVSIDVPAREYNRLAAGEEGVIFISELVQNHDEATLHKYELKNRKSSEFLPGVSSFNLAQNGTKIIYRTSGKWYVAKTSEKPSGVEPLKIGSIDVRMDPRAEWKQIFRDAWRFQRDYLYVPNVHGADWKKVYDMYSPLVEHVSHRSDLTYLLDILGGEVSIGHSFTGGGDNPKVENVSIGLLGADYEISNNRYRVSKVYNGESWNPDLRSPLGVPGVDVTAGTYIISVDGVDLTSATNIYSVFENKANRQVQLQVSATPDGKNSRSVTVVPVDNEYQLRLLSWVESNRRKVDELSGGKLAYVWLPNTADQGFAYFNRYYFAQQDKAGVVLDERFNGGGFIADYFVDILNRKLRGYFNNVSGDRRPWTEPLTGIHGPKVMIINEMAGSGGDMLPYLFRHMNIGPLVGTKTWGGLVGIWDTPPLVDGGYITAPRGGFYNLKGEWDVENIGIAPDIDVEMTPKDVIEGHDPQLEKAVEEGLRLIKEHPVNLLPEPAPPVRVLRPKR